jgi:O-antigen/teichoic acid export membrane protein
VSAPVSSHAGSALHSAAYVFGARIAVQLLSVAKGIFVARLLGPSDLGAFFLVTAVVGALEIASHPGLEDALIDSSDERPSLWQAAWTFLIVRGAVVSGLLVLLAAPISSWLNAPEIAPLLRVVALVPLLRGFTSLSLTWTRRRVDLRPAVKTELVANIVETVLGVALVVATGSPWALVAAMLCGTAARTLWSFRYDGFSPRFRFSWAVLRPLVWFSKWRFVSNLLYYVSVRADDLLVGRYLGRDTVGNYRIAYRLANLPTTEIVTVLEQVAFPALAQRAKESPALAIDAYHRYLMLTCGLAGPLVAVVAALAQPIVATLLGPAYAAAATPLAIMCVAGYLRAIVSTSGSLVLGLGRPQLDTLMSSARAVVLVVAIVALARYGIVGAAVASLLSLVVTIPLWLFVLAKIGARPVAALGVVVRRLPVAVTAGAAAWSVTLVTWGPFARLLVGGAAGLVGGAIGVALFDRPLGRELSSVARRLRAGFTGVPVAP